MEYTPSTKAWIKLPLELLQRSGIGKSAAVLLAAIIDECKHEDDLTKPISVQRLIQKSGYSRATVFRLLQELRDLGLIEVQRTGRTSIYTLTQGCVELCPKAVQDEQPQQQQPTPRARKQRKAPTEDELRKMKEYTALANRFKDDPKDEPQPGQQSFPVDDPAEDLPPLPKPKPTVSDNVQEWLNEHGISTLL